MKYYLVTKNLNYHNLTGWQLLKGQIIQDVGSNMFIARSISQAIKNNFSQLDMFEMGLVRLYIQHGIEGIEEV